ncbi:unnamed protein product [Heterobilharzia americana]|nr:unnamed protein product [Heterobilharzia americana]
MRPFQLCFWLEKKLFIASIIVSREAVHKQLFSGRKFLLLCHQYVPEQYILLFNDSSMEQRQLNSLCFDLNMKMSERIYVRFCL